MQNDLIYRSALKKDLLNRSFFPSIVKAALEKAPAVDAVSRAVFEQIKWERDCAMQQLKDHGIPFGGIAPDVVEVVRCKDCKHWHEETGWCYHHSHFITPDGEACHPWESANWKMLDENDFCSYGERRTDDGK